MAGPACVRSAFFFLKVLPMLPSGFVDRVTGQPVREQVAFSTDYGCGSGDIYLPAKPGKYPGIVVCLGVVPFGFDRPQVPRLGAALAQSGFAALLFQSPHMQDYRLDPEDIGNVAAAYDYLIEQPYVRAERSGLLGTCVGGGFVLLAAAHPAIRDKVRFVAAFAPFASMQHLAPEIASSRCVYDDNDEYWPVDQLTRKVFIHSLTEVLDEDEREALREKFADGNLEMELPGLSPDGEAIRRLLAALDYRNALAAYEQLPAELLKRMTAMSPLLSLEDIHAGLIVIGHDRDDKVLPVGESRSMAGALRGHPGVHYTEFGMFQHADPTKRKLSPFRLLWELSKFYRYVYPIFR